MSYKSICHFKNIFRWFLAHFREKF